MVLLLLCIASSVTAAAPRPEFTRVSPSRDVAAADTTKVKKERVRKKTPPARSEEESGTQARASESAGGFWAECLGSIFGSFLGSLCGGNDNETAEELTGEYQTPLPADMQAPAGALAPVQGFPYAAVIEPNAKGEKTTWLWTRPGGSLADGNPVEGILRGTEVRVTDYEFFGQTMWLQVNRLESDARQGWVQQTEVRALPESIEEAAAGDVQPVPSTSPSPKPFAETSAREHEFQPVTELGGEPSAERPRWEIGAGVSMPVFSQKAVREEYKQNGVRVGVEADVFLPRSMKLCLCVDYLHANGMPLYDYIGGTITDSPQKSNLDIFSIGLPFGQSIPFAGGLGLFSYGLGPALFMVRESALIHVYENGSLTGARTDELTKWKGGAEAVMAVGGVLGDRWPLSFQTRFAFIPWEADEGKSLTLDYLGTKDIAVFTLGIGIGFSLF